ncbi:MAG: dipeptidyl peptidase 3 [Bacteroidales bacterium]|nr:dipeptidyl peptidase 3 [Bacteroidales bacterium]OJX83776.1 MAG: dihydrofolate reductase [Paludibacter sp. 47-17]
MKKLTVIIMSSVLLAACSQQPTTGDFQYEVDRFADVQILRYKVNNFENLTLNQKLLVYYLSQAAIEGRDILYDQNHKHNLTIRKMLEAVYVNYKGDRNSKDFEAMTTYLKQVWMGNGIHHHYSEDKFTPLYSEAFLKEAVLSVDSALLPLANGEDVNSFMARVFPVIFDPALYPKRTNQEDGVDLILTSANNFYEGVTQAEVEAFYKQMAHPGDPRPVSYGLNSKVVKIDGKVQELKWKVGGMYSDEIIRIVGWLHKAVEVAENDIQKKVIGSLIDYYETGDLATYDKYSILWLQDVNSQVDFVNGFTETYTDPLGMKATWESIVNFKDVEATKRTTLISDNAQWFEDNSPTDKQFKKEEVRGVTAKVITAAMLGGDCYPATPIGINLPNSNWIRAEHGSKSVTIENITEAYSKASAGSGFMEEFMWSETEIERAKSYGSLTDNLHTDLHECLGHGSGKLLPGVSPDALKAYGSPIEEARADLFGLYYMADPKMVELGLLPDKDAYKAQYYSYLMNGLMTQLTRIQPGKNIEQAHMRNRQLIASWVYEKGKSEKVVELRKKEGKTYVVVNNYEKLRGLFGDLLREIQRIKSTGDLETAKQLVETYAVKVNQDIHKEVLDRYAKLNIAPYRGFVNPVYTLVKDNSGVVTDVTVSYDENYVEQHLRYSGM